MPPLTSLGVHRLVPTPASVSPAGGAPFVITNTTTIIVPAGGGDAARVGEMLGTLIRPATGFPVTVTASDAAAPNGSIVLRLGGPSTLGSEGYELAIGADSVRILAAAPAGLFHGTQTLRQLLPAAIEAEQSVHREASGWSVPAGRIVDTPRFAWRGAMLDVARHFFTVDEVKQLVDVLALYKLNTLHLHLADDQGWRIQIDSWPQLATLGGGPGTGVGGEGPGYLTKADYADLVAYAAARFITVVPEIDMPGHTNAALSTYAELNCDGVAPRPRTDTEVGYSSLCIGTDVTYRFVEDVIRELAAMTPGDYVHIGGDEAKATTPQDYRTFMDRVIPLVGKYGKKVLGWHEIATVDPPTSAVPQYWDTTNTNPALAAAAARGNKVVMSPANKAYLDMKYNASTPLGLNWAGFIEVRDAYEWNPASHVTGVGEAAVLGVEAPLWSETLRTLDNIEFMAFPRLAAIAELGWSPPASHDWAAFSNRLGGFGPRWTLQGVDFYRSPQVSWR
jgi:hexosaminidase